MRTYQFDDQGLHELIEIAFKHGYTAGAQGTNPWEKYSWKEKERTLDTCTHIMDYGKILLLNKPELY